MTAGDDRGYLDAVTITADESETGQGPAGRAIRTATVQVDAVDDDSFGPWATAARERGFESVAAVPLRRDDTVYGVMAVYSTRKRAFTERERAGLGVLGRTVGTVIGAARSRELLFADAVVELEFDLSDADTAIGRVARDLDCELALDGYVASNEQWILYLDVRTAAPDAVAETIGEESGVERARVLRDAEGAGEIEVVVSSSSLLHTVAAAGANLRTAVSGPDGHRLVVEAPAGGEIRNIVERVRTEFPGASLLARRECDRSVQTVGRPADLLGDLTDRQREVLEAAYRSGYFAWPRESTAEEIAATLDLSAPTLHGHLRKAEASILSALIDGE